MRPTEAEPLSGIGPLTVTETLRRGPVSLPVSRLPTAARGRHGPRRAASRRAAARAASRPRQAGRTVSRSPVCTPDRPGYHRVTGMMPPIQHRLRTRAESHHDGGNHGAVTVT
jgi:hypothetical protein